MPFKVIIRAACPLDAGDNSGWNLNLWNTRPSLGQAMQDAIALANAYNVILAKEAKAIAVRVSDIDNYRNAQSMTLGPKPSNALTVDYTTTAIHLTCYGTTLQPTPLWLRGLPDSLVVSAQLNQGALQALPGWQDFLLTLTGSSGGAAWAIRRVPASVAPQPIAAFGGLLTVTPTLTPVVVANLVPGDKIRIQHVKGAAALNRVWTVTSISADGLTVGFGPLATPLYTVNPVITNLGAYRDTSPDVYLSEQINQIKADYATKHNVGNPPKRHTGRRKIRR